MRLGIVLALVLCLASACGSSSSGHAKREYEHRAASVLPAAQSEMLKRRFALEASRAPTRAQKLVTETEAELRTTISALQQAKPPKDIAADHARLVAGYRLELQEIRALEPLARLKTTDRLRLASAKLSSSAGAAEVTAALEAIVARGYDLGFPPGS